MKQQAEKLRQIIERSAEQYSMTQDWELKASPEKWSAKQILGHLIDSANNNMQRFVRGTYEQNFRLVYDQNAWVLAQGYDKAPAAELLTLWILLNRQIVRILENYPPEKVGTKLDVGQRSPEVYTVQEIAEDYITHLNHHLNQINTLLNNKTNQEK